MSATRARRLRLIDRDHQNVGERSPEGGHMRIAFATQDLKTLDAHFAGARNMAIYEISPDGWHFVEAVRFDMASNEDGVHAETEEDRIGPRVDAIAGCSILFVLAIGGPAAARVVNHRIHPIKVPHPEPIADVLERVRTMLNGSPPPWLRKVLEPERRFDPARLEAGA